MSINDFIMRRKSNIFFKDIIVSMIALIRYTHANIYFRSILKQ